MKHLRELVAAGYVGEVLSTTLMGSGGQWGGETDAAHAYLYDRTNRATLLSGPLAHSLAGLREVLGEVGDLSARMINKRTTVRVTDAAETIDVTTPDQVMVRGNSRMVPHCIKSWIRSSTRRGRRRSDLCWRSSSRARPGRTCWAPLHRK